MLDSCSGVSVSWIGSRRMVSMAKILPFVEKAISSPEGEKSASSVLLMAVSFGVLGLSERLCFRVSFSLVVVGDLVSSL